MKIEFTAPPEEFVGYRLGPIWFTMRDGHRIEARITHLAYPTRSVTMQTDERYDAEVMESLAPMLGRYSVGQGMLDC